MNEEKDVAVALLAVYITVLAIAFGIWTYQVENTIEEIQNTVEEKQGD